MQNSPQFKTQRGGLGPKLMPLIVGAALAGTACGDDFPDPSGDNGNGDNGNGDNGNGDNGNGDNGNGDNGNGDNGNGDNGNGDNGNGDNGNGNGEEDILVVSGIEVVPHFDVEIDLHIGDETYTTERDETSTQFRFEIDEDEAEAFDADDYVLVRARPVDYPGPLAPVYVSHVGEWDALEAALGGGDEIDEGDLERLVVDEFRTAEAGHVTARNDGAPVSDFATFESLLDEVPPGEIVLSAAALSVATSEGIGFDQFDDTEQMAADPSEILAFVEFFIDLGGLEAVLLAGEARDILAAVPGADHDDYESGAREPDYRQVFTTRMNALGRDGAFQAGDGDTGRLRRHGFDAAELTYDEGVAEYAYEGELTLSLESELGEQQNTRLLDRMTLLSPGERSDIVLIEGQFEMVRDGDSEVVSNVVLAELWHADSPLPIDSESLAGDWVIGFLPDHPGAIDQDGRNPNDLRVHLEDDGTGDILAGGWNAGESVTWSVADDVLTLEAGDDALTVSLVMEPFSFEAYQVHVEVDDDGERRGFGTSMIPADHDSEWTQDEVAGYYLLGDGETTSPLSAPIALELDDDQSGQLLEYDAFAEEFVPLAPVGWNLEDGDLVIRLCVDSQDGESGLTDEPAQDECDIGYDRRAWEPAGIDGDPALVVDVRDIWTGADRDPESPNVSTRAMREVLGRYETRAELEDALAEVPAPVSRAFEL